MTAHADTALDQLAVADRIAAHSGTDWPEERQQAHVAALVHALLEVATALREAGMDLALFGPNVQPLARLLVDLAAPPAD